MSWRFATITMLVATITAILVILFLPTPAKAFFGSWDFPVKKPSAVYKVETAGWDIRVYEWLTEDGNSTCVAAFAEAGPVGMQCTEKGPM